MLDALGVEPPNPMLLSMLVGQGKVNSDLREIAVVAQAILAQDSRPQSTT